MKRYLVQFKRSSHVKAYISAMDELQAWRQATQVWGELVGSVHCI